MSRKINFFVRQMGTVAILCILCALFFMVSGCGKSNSSFYGNEEGCEDVICSFEYRHISLKLEYPDGKPVLLDKSTVYWVSKKCYLEQNSVSWNAARVWGSYNIINDGMQKTLQNRKEVMRFTGYLKGKIVCERDVLVGANCCHVVYYGTEPLTQIIQY